MSDKESSGGVFMKITRLGNVELIELIRQRPCLWDRGCPEYRSRVHREKAWAEVFHEMEPTYESMSRSDQHEFGVIVTRKWNNIRDSYRKYRFNNSRIHVSRPYVHAEYLTFLDTMYEGEHYRPRKRYKIKSKESEDQEQDEPDEEDESAEHEQQEWLNEVFVDMDASATDGVPTKKVKTEFSQTKDHEVDESIVSVLLNLIEKEEDEDRAFFKSITPTVKSLPEEDKFLFRIQVMKLLNVLKKRNRRDNMMKRKRESQESDTE